MKLKLMPKFVFSLAILGLFITVAVTIFSYQNSKVYLEDMYAQRVMTGSMSIADMMDADDVRTIKEAGGNETEAYQRLTTLFDKLKKDGEITFLSLVVPDEDSVIFYIDACVPEMGDDPAGQIPYGSDILYTDAASDEADLAKYHTAYEKYSQNKGLESPLVTDNSYGYNYTAVYPVLDENGNAIAEVQYILDMQDVRDYLNSFLFNMLLIALCIIAAGIGGYIVFVRFIITKPIGKLENFTREITQGGEFENKSIILKTGDEIEALGDSFNFMLREIEEYMTNLEKITAEKERIGAELDIATQIQASMLPRIFPAFPNIPEIDIFASMTPAKEVGGDFYDFFMVDDTHLAVVMADVSGKGVPAALFMVIGKTLIKDHTQPGRDLGEVFEKVNSLLCEANSEGLFITAFEGVLDLETGLFRYVNAGHEKPFTAPAGGDYELLQIKPGFVLAGRKKTKFHSGEITLNPGDRMFLYTDGVPEATRADDELFGLTRLKEVLCKCRDKKPDELLPAVKAEVDGFVGDAPQFDDLTMLCLEYKERMGGKRNERADR